MNEETVTLYCPQSDRKQEFELEHANRIVKAQGHAEDGWQLKDSNFELNKNGIIIKRRKGSGTEPEEQTTA